MKEEEKILIEQAKHGDNKAFDQLYERYHRLIRYIIFDIVKDDELTQDLLSNTFIKAFSKLSSYVNPISFEAWLKTIAVNTTIDHIRATKDLCKNFSIDNETNTIQLEETAPDGTARRGSRKRGRKPPPYARGYKAASAVRGFPSA